MSAHFLLRSRTSSIDEAEALLNERHGHVSVSSPRLVLTEEHSGDDGFALGRVELTGGFEGTAELFDRFMVDLRVVGGAVWEIGRDEGVLTSQPVLFQPGRPVAAHMGDSETRTLALERSAREATPHAVHGDDRPVELEPALRAHSPSAPSPERHLQHARPSAAHADLIAGDPTRGGTVGEIAARWGFPHPGRFARLHRTVHGQNSKSVLDR